MLTSQRCNAPNWTVSSCCTSKTLSVGEMPMRRRVPFVRVCLLPAGIAWAAAAAGSENTNPQPKAGGTDNDPLIQMEVTGVDGEQKVDNLLTILNQLPWASRTAVFPRHPGAIGKDRRQPKATAAVAIAERQWADLVDLANRLRKAGFSVQAIHLTHFGTVRIRTQFGIDQPTPAAQQ